MAMILEGGFMPTDRWPRRALKEFADPAPDFFDRLEPDAPASDLFKPRPKRQEGLFRETDVEALIESSTGSASPSRWPSASGSRIST